MAAIAVNYDSFICSNGYSVYVRYRNLVIAVVHYHYIDVIMGAMASQITSLTIVYSTVYSGADHRKHESSAPLAPEKEIHRGPVNSPHKGPVTRKIFPFDYVTIQSTGTMLKVAIIMVLYRDHFGMGSANERRRYFVTLSLLGWAHTQNEPCFIQFLRLSTILDMCDKM